MKKKLVAMILSAVLFTMSGTSAAFAAENPAAAESQIASTTVQTAEADTEVISAEDIDVSNEAVVESTDTDETTVEESADSDAKVVSESEAVGNAAEDAETMPQYETAANGIEGNGTNGIYIDINAEPYTTYANKSWGQYAYTTSGCAWFASACVHMHLTGAPHSTVHIQIRPGQQIKNWSLPLDRSWAV